MHDGEEIFGTFVLDGTTFDASYRFDGLIGHQGGYSKCLFIGGGHDYFGDDKFQVEKASIYYDEVLIHLASPLRIRTGKKEGTKTIHLKIDYENYFFFKGGCLTKVRPVEKPQMINPFTFTYILGFVSFGVILWFFIL